MADDNTTQGIYDSKTEIASEEDFVKLWLDQIDRLSTEEKDWRDDAEMAEKVYAGHKDSRSKEFNIFHANIEVLCPAVYNSTPIPDVRRRYADKDPTGKVVSDILERSLSYAVDVYDFDSIMYRCVQDAEIVDRGVARVRYVPHIMQDEQGNEFVGGEEVVCEHVLWRDFRRGPGRSWDEVPWIAFKLFLSRDEIAKLVEESDIDPATIPLNFSSGGMEKKDDKNPKADVFKRGMVWEIWDKESKKIIFISPDYRDRVLKSQDDPLELSKFYPIPKPIVAIEQTSSLVPIVPFKIYESLVEELNVVTRRITRLVKALRPRGLYGGQAADIEAVSKVDDGELAPASDVMAFLQNGGLDKAISWFPLDPVVQALRALYEQRGLIVQTIYEVTGISDIVRGATNPNETLGAQQMKAQSGSMRLNKMQKEVERFARNIFEIKAEIIATKFKWETITAMTGIDLPDEQAKQQAQMVLQQVQQAQQAQQQGMNPAQVPPTMLEQVKQSQIIVNKPSREEVMRLLQDDVSRNYRIDVESDSTIRSDLSRNQQNMNMFLQGTAQFAAAMGPLIMTEPTLKASVMEIYGAFARQFKLGRQAEDVIDATTQKAAELQDRPPPPNPQMEMDQAKMAHEKEMMGMQTESARAEHVMKMEAMQAELILQRELMQIKEQEVALKEREMVLRMQAIQQKAQADAEAIHRQSTADEHKTGLAMATATQKHAHGMQAMSQKAQAKPANGGRK